MTLPYLEQPVWRIGPATVSLFQVLILAGYAAGYWLCLRRAARAGVAMDSMHRWIAFVALGAMLGAVLFKNMYLTPRPSLVALRFAGISSFGGIWGAVAASALYGGYRRQSLSEWLRQLNVLAYAFPVALLLGRVGCALAHDHPGIRGTGLLAVAYPGGPRYDLAAIEVLFLLPLSAVFLLLGRTAGDRPFAGWFLTVYGPFRIWLDRLHESAPQGWLGQNIDAWAGLLSLLCGVGLLLAPHRRRGAVATIEAKESRCWESPPTSRSRETAERQSPSTNRR
ncbi:MAG: prolipoprotein diacylglyceryl transferase [Bryobacterales bacterium]|nr:prolipoprotein diacylglyceryl transferase [Bryobacterales bacterium]